MHKTPPDSLCFSKREETLVALSANTRRSLNFGERGAGRLSPLRYSEVQVSGLGIQVQSPEKRSKQSSKREKEKPPAAHGKPGVETFIIYRAGLTVPLPLVAGAPSQRIGPQLVAQPFLSLGAFALS